MSYRSYLVSLILIQIGLSVLSTFFGILWITLLTAFLNIFVGLLWAILILYQSGVLVFRHRMVTLNWTFGCMVLQSPNLWFRHGLVYRTEDIELTGMLDFLIEHCQGNVRVGKVTYLHNYQEYICEFSKKQDAALFRVFHS